MVLSILSILLHIVIQSKTIKIKIKDLKKKYYNNKNDLNEHFSCLIINNYERYY